jgi:protein LSM14
MMQQQQNGQQRGNKSQNTLKFDNEFDFEQANSKFEELRSQLAKLKVGSEENKQTPEQQVN